MGLERPPARPESELVPAGAPALDRARPALGAPPLRPAGGVLRALPRRVDDLQLRGLLARGHDARGGPGDQARARVHQARPAGRRAPARRRLRLGQLRGARRGQPRRPRHRHHAVRCRRPSAPAPAPRRPASPTASTSASRTGASCSGERFDAIASIGMVEHVGNVQIDAYAQRLRDLLEPEGRLLNHGIARVRHGDPEAGPFSERYVFPDAAPLHVGRVIGAFELAGLPADHIEGFQSDYAETLRHWAMRLDENLDRATRARRRPSACASGGCTCAPPGRASRRASPRSTRSARRRRASCSPPWAPRARRSASRRRGRPAAARSRRGRGSGPPGPRRDRRR